MLHNSYFALRHGQSKANAADIIISSPDDGKLEEFSLTQKGEEQVRTSVTRAREAGLLGADTIIVSSPFSRCKKSAEIAREVLASDAEITFDDRLRERWFGNWERQSVLSYEHAWREDAKNPSHTLEQVESAQSVQDRAVALVTDLEKEYQGKKILLVSHADVLQILQTWLSNISPSKHHDLPLLETGEVRELEQA